MLTPEDVQFFRDNGYLVVRGALGPEEVRELRDASQALIDAAAGPGANKDYQYGTVRSGETVLRRIEYIQSKGDPFLRLLASPTLLDAVQKIIGERFVPTFDSVVIKMPGAGVEVPWHRDGGGPTMFYDEPGTGRRLPAANFDIYLDEANETSGALYVIPGSNKDTVSREGELAAQGEYAGVPGAVRVDMRPGDLLVHDVTLYHGSPETRDAPLRRVIYYEFRDMRFIDAVHRPEPGQAGPIHHKWPEAWTRRRLAVLQQALDARRESGRGVPFESHPEPALRVPREEAAASPTRVAHPGWDA